MTSLSRTIARLAASFHLALAGTAACAAEEDVLWPQQPTRIDRSRQDYERLPALQQPVDKRQWIAVPEHIQVLDSARFSFDGQRYRIGGIHPVGLKRICRDAEAGRWACGRIAAVFLGNLVRGKRLLCDAAPASQEIVLLHCQSGSVDLAVEIIAHGFGQVQDDASLVTIEALARNRGAGLWRSAACNGDFDHC